MLRGKEFAYKQSDSTERDRIASARHNEVSLPTSMVL